MYLRRINLSLIWNHLHSLVWRGPLGVSTIHHFIIHRCQSTGEGNNTHWQNHKRLPDRACCHTECEIFTHWYTKVVNKWKYFYSPWDDSYIGWNIAGGKTRSLETKMMLITLWSQLFSCCYPKQKVEHSHLFMEYVHPADHPGDYSGFWNLEVTVMLKNKSLPPEGREKYFIQTILTYFPSHWNYIQWVWAFSCAVLRILWRLESEVVSTSVPWTNGALLSTWHPARDAFCTHTEDRTSKSWN